MNIAQALASTITCSQGLGRLLPQACARRWKIANDKEPGDVGQTAHICQPCPDGKRRAKLVELKPRPKQTTGRLNGAADKNCRACGGTYRPAARNQSFCKDAECQKARTRANVQRYTDLRRARLNQKPKTQKTPAHQ